jgi:hypothetical protein
VTDKQLEPVIRTWLQGTDRPPADSQRSTGQIMARLPDRERRRRWWPFFRQTSSVSETPPADRITGHPPRPIPASNGHSPTVIGRTQLMFSPAKAITVGVVVFALGGAVLIAQPFDQQGGSVPGAATDTEVAAPIEFSATFTPSSDVRVGTYETVDGVIQQRGNAWSPVISGMSDPRLDGVLTYSEDSDLYPAPGASFEFGAVTYRISTADGAWQGSTPIVKDGGGYCCNSVVVLVGEGAYEGLYAWMDTSDWDAIHGVIFPAPAPPAPTAP